MGADSTVAHRFELPAAIVSVALVATLGACRGELGPGYVDEELPVELCVGEVEVPDPALRALLEGILPQPEPPEGEEDPPPVIRAEALRELTGLKASGLGIQDLTGLECALRIRSLGLADNLLTDLTPLLDLTGLRELELSGNRVTDLSVIGQLPELRKVALDGNGLSDVSGLANLRKLTFLDLASNEISDITPLAGLEELRVLVLSKNQLTDVGALADMHELVSLKLDDNAIEDIDALEGLTKLHYLDLDGNLVMSLAPLHAASELVELEVSRNALRSLAGVENKPSLIRLIANQNDIESTAGVAGLTRLTTLELGDNEIEHLPGIETLVGLRKLGLAINRVTDISAVSGLPELRELDLRNNPGLTDIGPVSTLPLLGLFAAGGHDGPLDLSPLAGRTVLRRITFTFGETGDLGFLAELPALEVLNFQGTPLSAAQLQQIGAAPGIRTLDVGRTDIDSLQPLEPLALLEELSAEDNRISALSAFASWPGLRVARMAGNTIVDLGGVETLEVLSVLDLSRTTVDDLGPLVANETFRNGDLVTLEQTALDEGDCPDVAAIRARNAKVETDLACP